VLSSRNEAKEEARFVARLDVLAERVDTLASTVANTASAIAKKDGEIAGLQRALEARDQTMQALVEHVNRAAAAPAADVPVDATELRSLRNAVAALTKERANGVTAAQIQALVATLRALDERVSAAAAAAAEPPEELVAVVSALRDEVGSLAAREAGVTEAQLERHIGATTEALAAQSQRLDGLAETVGEIERTHTAAAERHASRLEASDDARAKLSQRSDALAERLGTLESAGALQEERVAHRFGKTSHALAELSQRLDAVHSVDEARLDRRFADTDDAVAGLAQRLDTLGETLGQLERVRFSEEERLEHRLRKANDALADLSQRVDAVHSVDERQLDRRFGETDRALATIVQRLETLAGTVESATAGLRDKERELATLQHHFTESSTRIESIVDDIREALHVLPVPSSTSLDELDSRLERIEATTRKSTEASVRTAGELSSRIDLVDHRLATVAEEVSRAKTLWPVALRSLEARLDDAVHGRRPDDTTSAMPAADEPADDVLVSLRDSLQAMEAVAAEMARASETLAEPGGGEQAEAPAVGADSIIRSPQTEQPPAAAGGGATIVPLRTGEP
jgi:DNA repair exonuclease SbcCD ATPase subunit